MEPSGEHCSQSTVLIADDHGVVRDGLKMLLSDIFERVRFLEAGDAASLAKLMNDLPRPDLAIIDLNMPGMERGRNLYKIIEACPTVPVVVVSALTSVDIVRRCLNFPSVFAFVSKSADARQLSEAITAAKKGIKSGLVDPPVMAPSTSNSLPPRLEEVRSLLRRGMSNKAIAQQLCISEGTVKNYMSEIFKLLNVSNRTQAAGID